MKVYPEKWNINWLILIGLLLPFFTLLVRGIFWGRDPFAFYAGVCGRNVSGSLSSNFFEYLLTFVPCDFFVISFLMLLTYVFGLVGLYFFFGNFESEFWTRRLMLYVLTLTPLFFLEGMRFENDLFGWSIAFFGLGLTSLFLRDKKYVFALIIWVLSAIITTLIWLPSIIVMLLIVFLIDYNTKTKKIVLGIGVIGILLVSFNYLLISFRIENIVGEELPLVAIVFILHIVHFYKYIPKKVLVPGILLLGLGLIKAKYMFLATPFLLLGLIQKEKTQGIIIKKEKFEVLLAVVILIPALFIIGLSVEPSHSDLQEIENIIDLADENNLKVYNEWSYGWMFIYKGYDTNFKSSWPNPDWNNLNRPFYAYSKEELPCEKLQGKRSYYCG